MLLPRLLLVSGLMLYASACEATQGIEYDFEFVKNIKITHSSPAVTLDSATLKYLSKPDLVTGVPLNSKEEVDRFASELDKINEKRSRAHFEKGTSGR
jgi:hypothetical protein